MAIYQSVSQNTLSFHVETIYFEVDICQKSFVALEI